MGDRLLGTIAMVCAPALLVESLLTGSLNLQGGQRALAIGVASMVFMAGWICSNTVMRRMRATGSGRLGRAVLLVQLVGLVLAFLFGFFEATGLLEGTIIFTVTDMAWPLSMLWMLAVGIAVIAAKRLEGWRRFVPVLPPFWLPIAVAGQTVLGDAVGFVGLAYMAVCWVLLGLVVRDGRERVAEGVGATPEPAVR